MINVINVIIYRPKGLLSFFVPCYQIGKNAEAVGDSCILCCLLYWFVFPVIVQCQIRGKIRQQKGIDVSDCLDSLLRSSSDNVSLLSVGIGSRGLSVCMVLWPLCSRSGIPGIGWIWRAVHEQRIDRTFIVD